MIDPTNKLIYRERKFKYQVLKDYTSYYGLKGYEIDNQYYHISRDGWLTAKALYSWDGASGTTLDDKENMVPALHHDIIYQAIRRSELPLSVKKFADDMLKEEMIERGASRIRAQMYHDGVTLFGGSSCIPNTDDEEIKEVV
jgi:hypothetical protein